MLFVLDVGLFSTIFTVGKLGNLKVRTEERLDAHSNANDFDGHLDIEYKNQWIQDWNIRDEKDGLAYQSRLQRMVPVGTDSYTCTIKGKTEYIENSDTEKYIIALEIEQSYTSDEFSSNGEHDLLTKTKVRDLYETQKRYKAENKISEFISEYDLETVDKRIRKEKSKGTL